MKQPGASQTPEPPFLETVPIFEGLAPEQLALVRERLHERPMPAGTEIITQGGSGDALFIVAEGSVKIHRRRPGGGEVILAVLGPGEVLGEMSLGESRVHSSGVATLQDSRVLWLDGETFRWMLAEMPSVRLRLVELLCKRLRLADTRLETLATLDVEGRVARVLLALAEEYGEPKTGGGILIPIPLTQSDIAAMTGASRVRVNQVLSRFKAHGWVTLDGQRRTSVRDAAALEALLLSPEGVQAPTVHSFTRGRSNP